MSETNPLPSPAGLREAHPLAAAARATVTRARAALTDALEGRDPRLLVIAGPCSIHDRDAALDYARRLAELAEAYADRLIVLMRTYFEKPRTTVGWKGMLTDPGIDGGDDMARGLAEARALLAEINALGLPCATELLSPVAAPYLIDGIAWVAIGARTTASQVHRELASGLGVPVGFKNPTCGSLDVMAAAVEAARAPHAHLGVDEEGRAAVVRTPGNPHAHAVLRGGATGPNHDPDAVERAAALVPLARPVLVDCSHANSGKDPRRQPEICRAVVGSAAPGLLGVMLESHLAGGRQDWSAEGGNDYGVSITDACLGWDETEELLRDIARSTTARAA